MNVLKLQASAKLCIICGLENESGTQALFYEMEDGSVCTLFKYKEIHQSYPQRVHGGMITAMLDELGFRAIWVKEPGVWGVTMSLSTKYRKPVPYDCELRGYGMVVKSSSKFSESFARIYDKDNNVLAEATIKYLKLPLERIANCHEAEEMRYANIEIPKEINF